MSCLANSSIPDAPRHSLVHPVGSVNDYDAAEATSLPDPILAAQRLKMACMQCAGLASHQGCQSLRTYPLCRCEDRRDGSAPLLDLAALDSVLTSTPAFSPKNVVCRVAGWQHKTAAKRVFDDSGARWGIRTCLRLSPTLEASSTQGPCRWWAWQHVPSSSTNASTALDR